MAKRTTTQIVPVQATLTVSRDDFKAKLSDRVSAGQEIYDTPISNLQQLEDSKREFRIWDDYNSEFLKQAFLPEENEYKRSYDSAFSHFIHLGGQSNQEKLVEHKDDIRRKLDNLHSLLNRVDLLKVSEQAVQAVQSNGIRKNQALSDNKQVFVVHGHNQLLLSQVARDLEKLDLKPIILSEQPNAGRTIIEKFEQNSEVGFAVVLLTDDDDGKAKSETDYKGRARQNVILELGYFIGKLGRARVCALHSDGVELPSDIHGLVYVPIDQSGTWKFKLVKELKSAGYDVDANKII